jgi:hypothetical protein
MIMTRHTDVEIEQAARRFEQLADELDPSTAEVSDTDDLQQVAAVSEAVRADEARLRQAVEAARTRGRSWNQIAVALGVSRQAARQRFTDKAHA